MVLICIYLISDIEHLFIAMCSLGKNVYLDPLPIFKLHFFFFYWLLSSLYFLDINPLADIWLSNIFSHSVDCFFILLMVSFAGHKPLQFDVHLLIFYLVAFAFGVKFKKSSPILIIMELPTCFLLRVLWFQVLCSNPF